jgi:hypothetical protein
LFAERCQTGVVETMSRAGRDPGQRGDFLKRQTAPEMGDDDLALIGRQFRQSRGGILGIEVVRVVARRAGRKPAEAGGRLMEPPTSSRLAGIDRAVPYGTEQPGNRMVWRLTQRRQRGEGLLNHVIGRLAPLPSVEGQSPRMTVDQASQRFVVHAEGGAPVGDLRVGSWPLPS